jgi:hypothetical protein
MGGLGGGVIGMTTRTGNSTQFLITGDIGLTSWFYSSKNATKFIQ